MDKFHRGMRRLAIVIWLIGVAVTFIDNTAFRAGEVIVYWSMGWAMFVVVVRWIWLGFFGKAPDPQ